MSSNSHVYRAVMLMIEGKEEEAISTIKQIDNSEEMNASKAFIGLLLGDLQLVVAADLSW